MTTIAYKDGILASDSQETDGYNKRKCGPKIIKREIADSETGKQAILLGATGNSYAGAVAMDWYGTNQPPPQFHDDDFELIIVDRSGVYTMDRYCRPIRTQEKFTAVGSGAAVALGAMYAGATAEEAVKIACKVDNYTSGKVITLTLDE